MALLTYCRIKSYKANEEQQHLFESIGLHNYDEKVEKFHKRPIRE